MTSAEADEYRGMTVLVFYSCETIGKGHFLDFFIQNIQLPVYHGFLDKNFPVLCVCVCAAEYSSQLPKGRGISLLNENDPLFAS